MIVFFAVLAYSNTLSCPFIFDDDAIRKGTSPPTLLDPRFLINLSFLLNYKLNYLSVKGYHVFNIIIHVINGLLIYSFVSLICKIETTEKNNSRSHYETLAFFISLIFVTHPIELFAVTYIVQRATSMAVMFYLLTLIFYIRFRVVHSKGNTLFRAYYALSLVFTLMAAKTKEITITLPVILALCEFVFFKGNFKKRLTYLLPFFLLIPLTIIQINAVGVDVVFSEPQSKIYANNSAAASAVKSQLIAGNRWEYLFTQFKVITTYLQMFFYPHNLTLIHYFTVSRTFFEPKVILAFLFLLVLFSSGAYLIFMGKKETKLAGFGLLWFFVTISPQSSIVPIQGWMIFEYRAYLASIGIYIAVIVAVFSLFRAYLKAVCLLLLSLSMLLTVVTYKYNKTWATEISMWEDNVRVEPQHPVPHVNLGSAYFAEKRYDDAIAQFKLAIDLSPTVPEAYNDLGLVYARKGLFNEALEKFKYAMTLERSYVSPRVNLGVMYMNRGMSEQAIAEFKAALEINRFNPGAHINLGTLYAKMGQKEKAIDEFKIVIVTNPNIVEPYVNLGALYAEQGFTALAEDNLKKAMRVDPYFSDTYSIMGTIYEERGAFNEASANYQKAIRYNKDNMNARLNLAAIYIKQGLLLDAESQYRYILSAEPNNVEVRGALLTIEQQLNRQLP
ncbi:tetratricopeptide repeat protein [Candidatus Magnetomonas plexicatena]|uniref:tetratricopeptide repeat protein n=1 Tax=Candidatus Magnetomonas plexicatena TaxID=2552947 RepID=UPI001C791F26|nr:tetratricopeptide repeat protein [Nitrospirales bacterium LBB_01]